VSLPPHSQGESWGVSCIAIMKETSYRAECGKARARPTEELSGLVPVECIRRWAEVVHANLTAPENYGERIQAFLRVSCPLCEGQETTTRADDRDCDIAALEAIRKI